MIIIEINVFKVKEIQTIQRCWRRVLKRRAAEDISPAPSDKITYISEAHTTSDPVEDLIQVRCGPAQ